MLEVINGKVRNDRVENLETAIDFLNNNSDLAYTELELKAIISERLGRYVNTLNLKDIILNSNCGICEKEFYDLESKIRHCHYQMVNGKYYFFYA